MAAVAAANESDLQATDAVLPPSPTPAAALDPRLLMAARRGDSRALKDLLQLNDDDQQLQGPRPDDGGSGAPTTAAAATTTTTTSTSVAAASSISPPHVILDVDPRRDGAVDAPLPSPPVPVVDEDEATTEGESLLVHRETVEQVVVPAPPPHEDDAAALPARQPPAGHSAVPVVLDEDGVTMEGDSLLHVVAACGDTQEYLDCAKMIVRNKEKKGGAGAKRRALEARNNKGDTPLHCAARAGNVKMIACLAALITTTTDDDNEEARAAVKKAFLRMQNGCGETALHQAIRAAASNMERQRPAVLFRSRICFLQLMNMDPELACIPHEDGASPLYLAISLGEFGIARDLCLQSNGKLSYSGPDGRNVLHAAVYFDQGPKVILECLMDTKPKEDNSSVSLVSQLTSQRDKKQKGSTPLHLAASLLGGCQTVGVLLDANESTAYMADDEGSYPIHVAAWCGRLSIMKLMLERHPDCATLRDGKGRTFLHVAAEKERCNVVRYVCGEMPQQLSSMILNAQDSNGDTALHGAVRDGYLAVFNCLFRNPQVCLDVANKDGKTPMDHSWIMLPEVFYYRLNPRNIVHRSLRAARARYGQRRADLLFTKKHRPKRDADEESKKYTEATQVMSIVTALIATVTFASAFTLPGGYRADGGPVLAGSYAFDAFILADTLAFICSISATCTLVYAGLPAMDGDIRIWYINVSGGLLQSAARSLVAAFSLGLYLVVHNTASGIAACVIVFASSLYGNMELGRIIRIATTVRARIGIPRRILVICLKAIFVRVLAHFWSYVIIFGLPVIRKRLH